MRLPQLRMSARQSRQLWLRRRSQQMPRKFLARVPPQRASIHRHAPQRMLAQVALIALVACQTAVPAPKAMPHVTFHAAVPVTVDLEVANTEQSRAKGLMYRKSLPARGGMVFVFAHEEPLSFWMKNTLIPLDMIFISERGIVVGVLTAEPMTLAPRGVPTPAKFVVEVNAGFAKTHGITVGTEVAWAL
jgi:uncharacterized membrane protein (UPF0127 family)